MTALSIILFTVVLMLVLLSWMAWYHLTEPDRFKHRLEWARWGVLTLVEYAIGLAFLLPFYVLGLYLWAWAAYLAFSIFELFVGDTLAFFLVLGIPGACLMHGSEGLAVVVFFPVAIPSLIIESAGDFWRDSPLSWEEEQADRKRNQEQVQREKEQVQREKEQAQKKKQEILSAKESGWSRVEIKAMLLRNRPLKERPEVLYRWKRRVGNRAGWSDWTVPSENTQGFVIGHSDFCLSGVGEKALSWQRDYRVEVDGAPYVLGSKLPEAGFSLAVWGSDLEPLFCHVLFNRVESPLRDHAHNLEVRPHEARETTAPRKELR